jgi:hypothetical protein
MKAILPIQILLLSICLLESQALALSSVIIDRGAVIVEHKPEYSLQESLDRLGFTVNVPERYQQVPLTHWGSYRTSTKNDSISAEWFQRRGAARFRVIGWQTAQPTTLRFSVIPPSKNGVTLLRQVHSDVRFFLNTSRGKTATYSGSTTFMVDWEGARRRLVFPAIRGGVWVNQGKERGYWRGGKSDGSYLFCWDDSADHDFQDLIIQASGIRPK